MSNWPKEDRGSFNRSEVMQEFERKIIEAAAFLSNEISKVAQESGVDQKRKDLAALRDDIAATKEALKNMAEDGESTEEETSIQAGSQADLIEESDLESQEAKMAMIEEMKDLVKEAVSEGNYKVAYQIERTISEILDGE
jgi:hypothetical protein